MSQTDDQRYLNEVIFPQTSLKSVSNAILQKGLEAQDGHPEQTLEEDDQLLHLRILLAEKKTNPPHS